MVNVALNLFMMLERTGARVFLACRVLSWAHYLQALACEACGLFGSIFLLWFTKEELQRRESWTEGKQKTMERGRGDVMKHKRKNTLTQPSGGVTGSIFAGYMPLASRNPYPIKLFKSILWPVIDPILVTFGWMKFSRSKLSHFHFMDL